MLTNVDNERILFSIVYLVYLNMIGLKYGTFDHYQPQNQLFVQHILKKRVSVDELELQFK